MAKDLRYNRLAKLLCGYSVKVSEGENVLIDACEIPDEMVEALIEEVVRLGGNPFVKQSTQRVNRKINMLSGGGRLETAAAIELETIKKMQCYIALRGSNNIFENGDIAQEQLSKISAAMRAPLNWRVSKTKWVVLRWPTPAMAQQASMSTEAFEDFYFDVCAFDYSKFSKGMEALRRLMESTDKVEILGNGSDLSFSIKGMPAIPCAGEMNIPDGEVFTAPVKNSVNGVIRYTADTVYDGASFSGITLEFKDGKIVKADASSNAQKLREILSSDEGASYVGEFAIGVNPLVKKPMLDILFDEKIAGSFHFTPGQAYDEADNDNRSKIHWDMVCIQTPEYGGGEIWFDGVLIRKDGKFVLPELFPLNPENLLGKNTEK
ncbi:MAG: aminopeptidase [Opitutales bacterium]|nr:aminopeptidase [Opitutales bacterium]